ncbi:unnamed protein product [Tilletia controversa]|nr:unnamed protein product [Tilletia controversa]
MLCLRPLLLAAARSPRCVIQPVLRPCRGPSFSTQPEKDATQNEGTSTSTSTSTVAETETGTGTVSKAPYDVLFCGTDDFACASLRALHQRRDLWKSITVVHPPETRQAWGAVRMSVAPVQTLASELGLEHVPVPNSGLDGWEPPKSFPLPSPASLLLTVSFGHLIPTPLLSLFPHPSQTLNLHPSLLPQLRGAAPLQWALAHGLEKTGVTVQRLSWGEFDCGRVLGQVGVGIGKGWGYEELLKGVKGPAAELLMEVLSDLPAYDARSHEQAGKAASFAPKLKREFTQVRWSKWSAKQIEARHRGMSYLFPIHSDLLPYWSPTKNSFKPTLVHMHEVSLQPTDKRFAPLLLEGVAPGSAMYDDRLGGALVVRCAGPSLLRVRGLKAEGKKKRPMKEWLIGYRDRMDEKGFFRFGDRRE